MLEEKKTPFIIAVCGKGGVGKTSLASVIVKLLVENHPDKKILAIDADPAVGLATALQVEPTATIDDIRKKFVELTEKGDSKVAIEMLAEARYQIFDALVEKDNYSFLAIGRPEAAGCYCKVNAYLKEVISLLANHFDYVVIDGEAGIEQVNRRVMEKVTHLILVSDASKKGLGVIKTIQDVAQNLGMFETSGAIINRAPSEEYKDKLDMHGIELLSYITMDDELVRFDIEGKNVIELQDNSKIVVGAKEALTKLQII